MVQQCFFCKKTDYLHVNLSFHRFPISCERRSIWVKCLGFSPEQVIPKFARICSNHFNEDDFLFNKNGAKCLKKNANPKSLHSETMQRQLSSSSESSKEPSSSVESGMEELSQKDSVVSSVLPLTKTDSGTTLTASETESYELGTVQEKTPVSELPGPSSRYRGNLSLVSKPKKRKLYVGDLSSDDFSSPKKAKRHFRFLKTTIFNQRKKIKVLQQNVRRLRGKINSMESLVRLLKQKSLISESSETAIEASVCGPVESIFKRMLKGPSTQKYDPMLRAFALTLAFYSPRAYNFVRDTFNKSMPHLGTISKWFRSVDGAPGFTQESLTALKLKTKQAQERGQDILCNLVMDEMSIRTQIEWDGHKLRGYVDVGTGLYSDILPEAREILVFMLVALNNNWKIPVGYFLINGLSAIEKANLVKKCLLFLGDSGITVTSFTFDGAATNLKMAEELGCNFSLPCDLQTSFKHPITNDDIFIFLDPSHMIKLVRNCFGTYKIINDGDGGIIDWVYIERLFELQNNEGLHAATKLKLRHLQWVREKMKVCIATQTLSKSVSDALLLASKDLKLVGFEKVDSTASFILKFNNLFDIFNSRNKMSKYVFKRSLSPATAPLFFKYLNDMEQYLMHLNVAGKPLLELDRKTGFLGFLISIKSLKDMYNMYVLNKKNISYILTYKISQDHLESFFGAIRSKGGFNNNPTARQFEAAYKRLIVHSEIKGPTTGNVVDLENIRILSCGSGSNITHTEEFENVEESEEYISYQKSIKNNIYRDLEENMFLTSSAWDLTDYVQDIVAYISGFVVKTLKKCVTCTTCNSLLESQETYSSLQNRKRYGKLINASKLIIDVCKAGEKYFRYYSKTLNIFSKKLDFLVAILTADVLKNLKKSIYDCFGDHFYNGSAIDSHPTQLIKLCLKNYFTIRIHYETKKKLDLSKSNRIRSINTKLILFKNQ